MTTREPLDASRFFAPGDRSLAMMLQAQAKKFGAKPLVQAGEQSWSFAEAPELAARSAGRLQAAGVAPGDRVALICENRPEFIEVFLGAAWLGAILVPINTASRGLQLRHILENSGAKLMVIEAALLGALEHVGLETLPLETIWVIDPPSGVKAPPIARPLPALGEAVRCGADAAERHAGHSLHVRHHRPVQGRVLPACAVLLVGRQHGPSAGRRQRRRALHDPAALPHQRAQHLLPGADHRRDGDLREPLLGVGLLHDAGGAARDGDLPSGRDGADPAVARGRARGAAGTARASRSPPACPATSMPSSPSAPASRCSTATARPKPIS